MSKKKYYIKEFWKNLPIKSYIKLLLAIFFIFSIIGLATDIFEGFKQSYNFLFINIIFSGFIGVFYAHTFIKQKVFLPIAILFHLSYIYYQSEFKVNSILNTVPDEKYFLFGLILVILIMLAYVFLMIFITGEGIPHIKLRTEMELAKEMHEVLVPEIKIESNDFLIYGKSIPISEVGGDLVDAYFSDGNLLCYIADVSGHGVSSGLFMGMFKSSVHTVLLNNNSLVNVFNNSNKALSNLKKQNLFLTAAGIMFKKDKTAEYSIAGHLPIIHFNHSGNEIKQLLNKQIPISVKSDFCFKSENITYNSGDIFILISDGIIEVFNQKNVDFGLTRIMELIKNYTTKSPEELSSIIFEEISKYGKQIDDQSLLIIKCK